MLNKSFILDLGATYYVCNNKLRFTNVRMVKSTMLAFIVL
jgi:hypothetical protein